MANGLCDEPQIEKATTTMNSDGAWIFVKGFKIFLYIFKKEQKKTKV